MLDAITSPSGFPGRWCETSTATRIELCVCGRETSGKAATCSTTAAPPTQDRTRRRWTYEPTVEETAAPSYLTWVPTTAPPSYPSSAPTVRPTVPRPRPSTVTTRRRRRLTDEQTELYVFGLRVGTAEGDLVIIADDTRASVSLGRTIDWRVFHHFCLTYDGPSRGGESTLAFYFDGDHQLQETQATQDRGRAPGCLSE